MMLTDYAVTTCPITGFIRETHLKSGYTIVRTPHPSMAKNEALDVFLAVTGHSDVIPVMVGIGKGWGSTIKAITGVKATDEQCLAFMADTSKGGAIGKVNRYFMFPGKSFRVAAYRAIGRG